MIYKRNPSPKLVLEIVLLLAQLTVILTQFLKKWVRRKKKGEKGD